MSARRIALAMCLVATVGVAWVAWPEVELARATVNDASLHIALAEGVAAARAEGQSPLDPWYSEWVLGYPVLHSYQPLAAFLLAGLHALFGGTVEIATLFGVLQLGLLLLVPLSFLVGARLLGLSWLAAGCASLLAPAITAPKLYGLDLESYLWIGPGLHTQLVAQLLLPLAIGLGARAIISGRPIALAGLVLGLTFLAHLFLGYVAALSLGYFLFPTPGPEGRRGRIVRLTLVFAGAIAVAAFSLLPMVLDGSAILHSRLEPSWKWDGFGIREVLRIVASGELLDTGRLPVVSVLALVGLVGSVLRTEARGRFLVFGLVLWLALFAGRSTFGALVDLLPSSKNLHWHRSITGAHFFAVLLAAVGLEALLRAVGELARRTTRPRLAATVATTLTLALTFAPVVRDRWVLGSRDRSFGRAHLAEVERARGDLDALANDLQTTGGGRVLAGLALSGATVPSIGRTPLYHVLAVERVPTVAFAFHAMSLASTVMYRFDPKRAAHYALFDLRRIVDDRTGPRVPPFATHVAEHGRFGVWSVPKTSAVDVVDTPLRFTGDHDAFSDLSERWMASPLVEGRAFVTASTSTNAVARARVVLGPGDPLPSLASLGLSGSPGRVLTSTSTRGRHTAIIEATRPAVVLLKESHHPGWRATVDGVPRAIELVSPGFVGVPVTAGRHQVLIEYRGGDRKPLLLAAGLLSWALLLALELKGPLRRPR